MLPCDFSSDPVCIPQEYLNVKQDVFGLRASDPSEPGEDAMARTGAKIVNLFSDAIMTSTPAGLSQVCERDVCVHYVKSCNMVALTCRYVIGVQSNPPDANFKFYTRELMVVAKSAEALSRAQGALEIGRPGGSNTIRLAQLTDQVSKPELEKRSAWRLG
jgi:hypothetical protein